ncbi:GntR family transcriptional regulator [Herbaspirillum sp. YR522]|uniref:GntR family transcriptional regulator n=1 Tax=Herbaspirillum sp. YR522 TaxID=1144342 RepID=UPI00026F64DA|nr:GntR family transcriptional regulator [Herbaspirillum sp. YR522]EJN09349.1 transcriptional regulator [Herbaspirillum sp. YR522]
MPQSLLADLSQVRKIEHATLSERVYRDLCELIQAGQVRPGQKLTLKGLADALGTSPMPVREAVRQLAAEGALEILPNRAMRVPLMTKGKFRELLKIRLALEGLAVEHAALHIDERGLAMVASLHDSLCVEMHRKTPNVDVIIRQNKQLHFAAYQGSGMPTLVTLIEGLWLQVGPVINLDLRAGSRRLSEAPALLHHGVLLKGLQQHSAALAREGLAGDLLSAADMILAGDGLPD